MKPLSKACRHSTTNVRPAGPKMRSRPDVFNAFNSYVIFTLQELATMSGGELAGDPALKMTGAASLAEATAGEISFFANRKYVGLLRKTRAAAVFVPPDFAEPIAAAQIRVSNPAKAFEQIVLKLAPKPITFAPGIHPNAVVDSSAQLGERVSIQPHAVIEAGAKIGDDTTIDRARFGRTWIQEGAKIDNLVQVAHNVVIGKNTVIAAQTGIAGSVRIGQRVLVGGQAGIIGNIEVGDNTAIGAQSGISKNISGGAWWASPAVPLAEAKQQIAWVRRLGKLFERVKQIEKKLGL